MNDILPPKRPLSPSVPSPVASRPVDTPLPEQQTPLPPEVPKKRSRKKFVWWGVGIFLLLVTAVSASAAGWYVLSLKPVEADEKERVRIQIAMGESPTAIGMMLEEKKLIRSSLAFDIYTRLSGTRNQLRAGTYSLSPSESTEGIVSHLVSGKADHFTITFLPGATLAENRKALIESGYSETEVDKALAKRYDGALFAGKPASANLEGYIYGETYSFDSSATAEQVLERTFEEFYEIIEENDLAKKYKMQGLTLYQGIIFASIIQREVPGAADQRQVAQIFLKRYKEGMELGSDVTAYYGADKIGVERSVAVDTPYNTRIHTGLPPGPIGTPGLAALQAVANPAPGDYVFFLSGDDDRTYFAHTSEQHEANIRDHCKIKCAIP